MNPVKLPLVFPAVKKKKKTTTTTTTKNKKQANKEILK